MAPKVDSTFFVRSHTYHLLKCIMGLSFTATKPMKDTNTHRATQTDKERRDEGRITFAAGVHFLLLRNVKKQRRRQNEKNRINSCLVYLDVLLCSIHEILCNILVFPYLSLYTPYLSIFHGLNSVCRCEKVVYIFHFV